MCNSLRNALFIGALACGAPAAAQEGLLNLFSQKPPANSSVSGEAPGGAEATPSKPITTRLSTFGIPVSVPKPAEGIKEIQLHVSADRGKTWHLYYRVGPQDKFFPFKAAADGEYWFATRLVHTNPRASLESDVRPEMKVLIDTSPPRLSLTSELKPSGEIIANWQAIDPLLSAQTLKLEYQTSPTAPWRSIAIPDPGAQKQGGKLSGKVTWFPRDASDGIINLRAEIVDQAGNHAVALDRVTSGAIARVTKPLEPPVAGPSATPKQESTQGDGALSTVSRWIGGAFGGEAKSQKPPADPYASSTPSDSISEGSSSLSNSSPSNASPEVAKPSSQWGNTNTELTDAGVRRTLQPRTSPSADAPRGPTDEVARGRSEKRSPGRLASATTVREPKREISEDFGEAEQDLGNRRPAIQPPENAQDAKTEPSEPSEDETPSAMEAEEIPPPRPEPDPANEKKQEKASEPSDASTPEAVIPADRSRAVESLPREDARAPIPSVSRKKPGEYRVRSPIQSGKKGDEQGIARPPAASSHRNVSAGRNVIPSSTESGRLPSGVEPIYSNRLRFGLEYDVNLVGSSGVSEVELWATRDGGQSWSRWGSDPDRRSPFDVEVDGEGVFGFRIVVLSRGGLASRPPQPGEEADQWIVVDSTVPQVSLKGVGYGADERVGQLEIAWDAQDANLTEKSVSLFYSDQEEGPWTRIVSDLANQGEYFWRVDSRIPPRIFVKVEVRDGAGNIAADQTREAIRVEGLVPSGKIRRIVPRGDD